MLHLLMVYWHFVRFLKMVMLKLNILIFLIQL